jgi:hypothetical protein
VSPDTAADTIGGVVAVLDSGAAHEAEAGPLEVQARGVGLGEAWAVGEADEDPPHALRIDERATEAINTRQAPPLSSFNRPILVASLYSGPGLTSPNRSGLEVWRRGLSVISSTART